MNSHKNAPLTPKGREAMVRSVVEGGLSQADAAYQLGAVDLEPKCSMPLAPTILTVNVENPHYIRVPMDDGKKIVTVHVSTSALRERAAQDLQVTSNLALLYCVYRESIEAAASLKYDQGGQSDSADIVLVAREIL